MCENGTTKTGLDFDYNTLYKYWIAGDKLQSYSFRDTVADTILERMNRTQTYPSNLDRLVYSSTTGANPLRSLAVDVAVYNWQPMGFKSVSAEGAMGEFFHDIAVRFAELGFVPRTKFGKNKPRPMVNPGCRYHSHGRQQPCYKAMSWARVRSMHVKF